MTTRTEEKPGENLNAQVERLDLLLSRFVEKEERRRHWKDAVIPLLSLLVALSGIVATVVVQVVSIHSQTELKQYEVTFITKQKAYSNMMASLHALFFARTQPSRNEFIAAIDKLQAETFSVQPFLSKRDQELLWDEVQQFIELCLAHYKQGSTRAETRDKVIIAFTEQRDKIRLHLMKQLFTEIK